MGKYDIDAYMLCPVRKATNEEKNTLEQYRDSLRERGLKVHYPAEDTPQEDSTGGYRICMDHVDEIHRSKSVHIYWNGTSNGSYVDLGTALGEHGRRGLEVVLINRDFVEKIVEEERLKGITKSYSSVLLKLDDLAKSSE